MKSLYGLCGFFVFFVLGITTRTLADAHNGVTTLIAVDHVAQELVLYDGHILLAGSTSSFPESVVYCIPTTLKTGVYELRIAMTRLPDDKQGFDLSGEKKLPGELKPAKDSRFYWRKATGTTLGSWETANYRKEGDLRYWYITLSLDEELPEMIEYYGVFSLQHRIFSQKYHVDFSSTLPFPSADFYMNDCHPRWLWSPQKPYEGAHTAEAVKAWIGKSQSEVRARYPSIPVIEGEELPK